MHHHLKTKIIWFGVGKCYQLLCIIWKPVIVQCPQMAGSLSWTSPGAQQEGLEKKIPLVTSRSSRGSSVIVIGLEVGQVDQGKRVIVQYIFYNLIISVFNDWCIRKIYRFIRFSACFDSHSAVCILWQGACLVQCPQTAGSLRTSPAVSLIPAIIS